jgi:hypothetical protein
MAFVVDDDSFSILAAMKEEIGLSSSLSIGNGSFFIFDAIKEEIGLSSPLLMVIVEEEVGGFVFSVLLLSISSILNSAKSEVSNEEFSNGAISLIKKNSILKGVIIRERISVHAIWLGKSV